MRHGRDGCKLADTFLGEKSSCFACPFEDCEKENPRLVKKLKRNKDIIVAFKEGKSVKELAVMFGVSDRTIQRALEGM